MREHTELSVKIAELNCTNKKLTDEKTKLQRSLDLAEDTNTRLTEEITDLKSKIKSSQQAMQHARSIWNELEDMKIFVKNLEDKISVVITEKKLMEKEEHLLSSHKQTLQEENDKLISEKEKVKEKLDSLRVENSKLLHQLYEYENLLAQKDELLTQKTIQTEELMGLVEEQKTLLQELKNEKNNLQEELAQTHEDIAIHSSLSHEQRSSSRSVWSVCKEIEEIQESNSDPKLALPDPLCHIVECSLGVETMEKETRKDTKLEEQSNILLKRLSCLSHLKCVWETYASKLKGAKQINTNNKRTRQEQRVQDAISDTACITGLFSEEGCSLAPFIPKMRSYFSTLRLFLVILLYTLIFSIWSGENIWTVVSTILWPHLKLQHLKLPPI
ncbi:protein KASH5 [Bufo gargarizans]|uniref:protein KASH5 n=1 Tax=Bufo gargarizans TaxID=30331 RepID=UPI001CF3A422|nr:protein KASH5 [Bufo gargarizans]